MPDPLYITAALGVAVAITVALRALPFVARRGLSDSPLLTDFGRWMPLGAVAVLAVYCLASIDFTSPVTAAGPVVGTVVTVGVHVWRRNAVLSIIAGTAACVAVSSWL